jgi:hypothetical protein
MFFHQISRFESKLKNIPYPSTEHLAALNELLERIYTEEGLSEGDVQYREELTKKLQDRLTKDEQLKGKVFKSHQGRATQR